MDYYFFIKLRRKVPTRKHKLGMDTLRRPQQGGGGCAAPT